jgi:hypothetical protein
MFGIIKTNTDKTEGIAKFNVIAHRWRDFNKARVYKACQQLEVAQPNLDGYITIVSEKKKKKGQK